MDNWFSNCINNNMLWWTYQNIFHPVAFFTSFWRFKYPGSVDWVACLKGVEVLCTYVLVCTSELLSRARVLWHESRITSRCYLWASWLDETAGFLIGMGRNLGRFLFWMAFSWQSLCGSFGPRSKEFSKFELKDGASVLSKSAVVGKWGK